MKLLSVILSCILMGCLSSNSDSNSLSVQLEIVHKVGFDELKFDTIMYQNEAGNKFSVTTLQYYISDFSFFGGDSNSGNEILYIDAAAKDTQTIKLSGYRAGRFTGSGFVFGIQPEKNKWETLPSTQEHINMKWPEPMGGGYHFMKLEGRYLDSLGNEKSYTVHIGNSADNTYHFYYRDTTLSQREVSNNTELWVSIEMDVLGWFDSADSTDYDFNQFGGIMGNGNAQRLLYSNGKKSAFSMNGFLSRSN